MTQKFFQKGKQAHRNNDLNEAIKCFDKALEASPINTVEILSAKCKQNNNIEGPISCISILNDVYE